MEKGLESLHKTMEKKHKHFYYRDKAQKAFPTVHKTTEKAQKSLLLKKLEKPSQNMKKAQKTLHYGKRLRNLSLKQGSAIMLNSKT